MENLCKRCGEALCEDGTDVKVMTSDLEVIVVCDMCQRPDDVTCDDSHLIRMYSDALLKARGKQVTGYHYGKPFMGNIFGCARIRDSSDMLVTVVSHDNVYMINSSTLYNGGCDVYKNLHVYL